MIVSPVVGCTMGDVKWAWLGTIFSYDLQVIDRGVNISGACNSSFIVITFNACWLTNHALAFTPPGTGMNVSMGLGWGVSSCLDWRCVGGALGSRGMRLGLFHIMAGTPPGVLFWVCRCCTRFVLINCWFVVGSCVCIMAGTFDILVISTANVWTGARGVAIWCIHPLFVAYWWMEDGVNDALQLPNECSAFACDCNFCHGHF